VARHGKTGACPLPCLVFAGVALDKPEYIALWKKLDADPAVEEVLRNLPVRQPVLWF
jgi:hypothetical protein